MKKLPLIGLTSTRMLQDGTFLTGMPKTFLNSDYSDAVTRAKGLPVIIPPVCSKEEIEHFAYVCDGLLVTGGKDVAPLLYDTMSIPQCGAFDFDVDESHIALIQAVAALGKPIFGICRGLQLINVAFGGTLYQDLQTEVPGSGGHTFGMFRHDAVHSVQIKKESRLYEILKREQTNVNSIHHQAIKALGIDVNPCAASPDGVIEAIEVKGRPILAVQWHPEMMMVKDSGMLPLFEAFISQCGDLCNEATLF